MMSIEKIEVYPDRGLNKILPNLKQFINGNFFNLNWFQTELPEFPAYDIVD